MSPLLKAAGGGIVAGIIGALIWGGITYVTHREVGWVAWGIGFIVGLGVRMLAGEFDGMSYGVLAVVIAIVSIVGGKFLAVHFLVSDLQKDLSKIVIKVTEDDMIESKADDIAKEWRAKGIQVTVGDGLKLDEKPNYTPAVMNEARKRWMAIAPAERQRLMAAEEAKMKQAMKEFGGAARQEGFASSFGPLDILWFILAAITAFKLGSGMSTGE